MRTRPMTFHNFQALYRYVLMAALRDRFLWVVLGALVVVVSLSVFFGASSLTERGDFAITFMAFGLRLFGVAALVLFVTNYARRCIDSRDIDYLLSRPLSRSGFVLAHAAAFSTLAVLSALVLGGAVALMQVSDLQAGLFFWWFSLAVEFIIMANIAMFFGFFLSSPTASLIIVFAFYLLSRLIGEIMGIMAAPTYNPFMNFLEKIMEVISIFLPRLDLMGHSKWILYGPPETISYGFIFMQGVVFVAVVVCATAMDMRRRQF